MTSGIGAFVATVAVAAVLSAPAFATKTPVAVAPVFNPNLRAIPYVLDADEQAISCENGQLAWPADLQFPAGLKSVYVPSDTEPQAPKGVPSRKQYYTLGFDVLQNGGLTNLRSLEGPYGLFDSLFFPAWAAAWSLGPQAQTLKGCRMKWTIRTGYTGPMAAVLTREALHLRNTVSGLPRVRPYSEACQDAARRIKTRTYPDRRSLARTPGRPQWVIDRFDVDKNGQVRVTANVGGNATIENRALVSKALSQHSYYDGDPASECLISYAISPDILPLNEADIWGELQALNRKPPAEQPASDTCPEASKNQVLSFSFRPEHYPAMAQRFKIEGVAMLTYDVAPWGEVKVRDSWSHPLPAFAQAAQTMLLQSKAKPSDRGLSGCQLKVNFVIRPDSSENQTSGTADLIGADDEAL